MAKKLLVGNRIERAPGDKHTHKVKDKDGKDFVPKAKRIALFKDSSGEWLDEDAWPMVDVTLVCRTAGCEAEGVEVEARVGENVDGVYRAGCGGCGNAIEEMWVDEAYVPPPLDPDSVKVGGK